jgi:hypothetical protein
MQHKFVFFKKGFKVLIFLSFDAYCDIKLYPSFHNQWAVALYRGGSLETFEKRSLLPNSSVRLKF